jgi:hypothetical protein
MKKQYEDDDGRVIASMDVPDIRSRRTYRRVKAEILPVHTDATKKEALHVAFNAVLAALLIACVLMGAVALVVLFLTQVW